MASVVAAVCLSLSVGNSSAKANDFQTALNNHLTSGDILLAQNDSVEAPLTQEQIEKELGDAKGIADAPLPQARIGEDIETRSEAAEMKVDELMQEDSEVKFQERMKEIEEEYYKEYNKEE